MCMPVSCQCQVSTLPIVGCKEDMETKTMFTPTMSSMLCSVPVSAIWAPVRIVVYPKVEANTVTAAHKPVITACDAAQLLTATYRSLIR